MKAHDDNTIRKLARPEIVSLAAYKPAEFAADAVRLNANEAPWRSAADLSERGLNRYPPHRPEELTVLLAEIYGVTPDRLFVTRGTSEAIDLLIRCFCRSYQDNVVICPPTFGMYEVYAEIQAAGVRRIPLAADTGFQPDVEAIVGSWTEADKLLFLTTPNNPTGNNFSPERMDELVSELAGRAIIVIDAAYFEFSEAPDPIGRYADAKHVVVLRTMSKAYGMAGARCGSVIADPELIALLEKVMPPYAMPTPSNDAAVAAIARDGFREMPERINGLLKERERVSLALQASPFVKRVYPSNANFLYVRFVDSHEILSGTLKAGLLLRDFSSEPGQHNCLRITIGDEPTNTRLLACIAALGEQG